MMRRPAAGESIRGPLLPVAVAPVQLALAAPGAPSPSRRTAGRALSAAAAVVPALILLTSGRTCVFAVATSCGVRAASVSSPAVAMPVSATATRVVPMTTVTPATSSIDIIARAVVLPVV
jgi:hypothetical protein